MKFLWFVALFATAFCEFKHLKVEKCGGDGSVEIRNVDVNPMPIHIPGKLNVVLDAALKRDIHGPISIKVRMYTKTWVGWIKFPLCIRGVGSCDYDNICEILEELGERGCPREELAALGLKIPRCNCPLPAADVQLAFRDIDLPKLPGYLSSFAAGDYKIEGRLYERGKEVTCFRAFASLA